MTKALLEKIAMVEKKVGKDWIKSLTDVSTQEQLEAKVSEWGIKLTPAESKEAFGLLSKREDAELSERELSEVAGGHYVTGPGGSTK